MSATPPSSDDLARLIRRHHRGVIHIEKSDASSEAAIVIEPRSGQIIAPVASAHAETESLTLFLPDDGPDSIQVHAAVAWIADPNASGAGDRWQAYHGRVAAARYGTLEPLAYRFEGLVVDAEEVNLRNPILAHESRLVKLANADRAALLTAARRQAGGSISEAFCVGVDHLGMDVRLPLGILRMEYSTALLPNADADQAGAVLRMLLAGS